ncbi:hypothetical protein NHF46_16555 [Arthrobacter alpinus]|nr:hypothetical protein [Arthrobacter alpinus]
MNVPDLKTLMDNEKLFAADVSLHGEEEERRLAYVAFTRARDYLMCSSTVWGSGKKPLQPSPFISELLILAEGARQSARISLWSPDPEEDAQNPTSAGAESAQWPYDPLNGPEIQGRPGAVKRTGRREHVNRSAAAVEVAQAAIDASGYSRNSFPPL